MNIWRENYSLFQNRQDVYQQMSNSSIPLLEKPFLAAYYLLSSLSPHSTPLSTFPLVHIIHTVSLIHSEKRIFPHLRDWIPSLPNMQHNTFAPLTPFNIKISRTIDWQQGTNTASKRELEVGPELLSSWLEGAIFKTSLSILAHFTFPKIKANLN